MTILVRESCSTSSTLENCQYHHGWQATLDRSTRLGRKIKNTAMLGVTDAIRLLGTSTSMKRSCSWRWSVLEGCDCVVCTPRQHQALGLMAFFGATHSVLSERTCLPAGTNPTVPRFFFLSMAAMGRSKVMVRPLAQSFVLNIFLLYCYAPSKLSPRLTSVLVCQLLGDEGVGKTSLGLRYGSRYPEADADFFPSVFDPFYATETLIWGSVDLLICDAPRGESRLRALTFPGTEVFLICFSVLELASFDHLANTWIQGIKNYNSSIPWILVGLKTDLRGENQDQTKSISPEEAKRLANQHGGTTYVECSALNDTGVREVFNEAALTIVQAEERKHQSRAVCALL